MLEQDVHKALTFLEIAMASVAILVVSAVRAPYGRHNVPGWGPQLPVRPGWILMESPALILFIAIYACGSQRWERTPLVLMMMWLVHYTQRTVIYPLLQRGQQRKTMPVLIVVLGLMFNVLNAYVNARWISHLGRYDAGWLYSPKFTVGGTLFVVGFAINVSADATLRKLRRPGESRYMIPRGHLFELVGSPNYLGEIIEWVGWAIATSSLAGMSFALSTIANLAPRAASNDAWYRSTFKNYPQKRKALIPLIW